MSPTTCSTPRATVRECQPDDLHGLVSLSDYMTPIAWAVIEEQGEIVGHGCVSKLHGKFWAHDLFSRSSDATAVARVYKLLIRLCRERGVRKVMTDVSTEEMVTMYRSLGWTLKSVILEGDIAPAQK